MTTDPVIPPPLPEDNDVSLSWWMRHSDEPRAWGMSPHVGSAMQAIIRRCHHAEQSLAAIRAERDEAKAEAHNTLVAWEQSGFQWELVEARLRKCIADVVAERDTLAAKLKQAEELLRPLAATADWDDADPYARAAAAFLASEAQS